MPKNPFPKVRITRAPRPKASRPATPHPSRSGANMQQPGTKKMTGTGMKSPSVRTTAHTGTKMQPRAVPAVKRPQ